jgi:hypothetical protein
MEQFVTASSSLQVDANPFSSTKKNALRFVVFFSIDINIVVN